MSGRSDPALDLLVGSLAQKLNDLSPDDGGGPRFLWCADEHPINQASWATLECAQKKEAVKFLTNRLDQYRLGSDKGWDAHFSDFVFDRQWMQGVEHVFIRVPKERALVHYLINQAFLALSENGRLWLFGYKGEGIKTHIARAKALFGGSLELTKGKNQLVCAAISKASKSNIEAEFLDDQNYMEQAEVSLPLVVGGLVVAQKFWSKPGAYGWNKIDKGSQFLAEVLQSRFESFIGKTVLDLGCGYGYLSMVANCFKAERVISTDNCAAALSSVAKNMQNSNSLVIASDAGDLVDEGVDLILCNPPFHQGFSMNAELHHKFLSNTKRLLRLAEPKRVNQASKQEATPEAWFVVNQFLSIDAQCRDLGLTAVEAARNPSFKVLKITI